MRFKGGAKLQQCVRRGGGGNFRFEDFAATSLLALRAKLFRWNVRPAAHLAPKGENQFRKKIAHWVPSQSGHQEVKRKNKTTTKAGKIARNAKVKADLKDRSWISPQSGHQEAKRKKRTQKKTIQIWERDNLNEEGEGGIAPLSSQKVT